MGSDLTNPNMDSKGTQQSQMTNFDQHQSNLGATDSVVDLTLRLGTSSSAGSQAKVDTSFPHCLTTNAQTAKLSHPFFGINPINYGFSYGNASKAFIFPTPPQMSNYCLINISNKTARRGGSRKRRDVQSRHVKSDENRFCTNYNCRVGKSPMWRKGPLGPKTLCNRCGIKYRKMKLKEEGERKAAEASREKHFLGCI